MRKQGTVTKWDAGRGFGFITDASSKVDVFFHAKDFRSGQPQEGQQVCFEEIHVGGKGPRAMAVQAAGVQAPQAQRRGTTTHSRAPRRSASRPAEPSGLPLPLLILLLTYAGVLVWAAWASLFPWWVLPLAAALNLATFIAYWQDKSAAQANMWRTPESTLQTLALAGGWPAAWFAQRVLRHKTSKRSFQMAYWACVVLHCAALGTWLFWW